MCRGTGLLATRENFGHIVECGCGTIHLTIGPVTVALDARSLRSLHKMVGQALERMDSLPGELPKPDALTMHESHLAIRKVVKLKY
ncbi:MAG TPA: hypothetical protein VMI32_09635 [Candidatus Solibacter sp.]|nr:hypothetical protein [Candidatus Solibacter sp.]